MSHETLSATRSAAGTDLIAPLVLLQLSDLHFGPHSRFAAKDLARLAAECRQALDEARTDLGWREDVGLVLVTGDIAEAARPPEYATAAAFFTALARELALSPYRFVFVPGNHDVSWTRCREVEGQLEDGAFPAGELRERLDAAKLAHFERFIRDFYGRAREEIEDGWITELRRGAYVHDFAELGVSVAALNSCERESHRKADHVGALGADQAQSVLDHWRGAAADRIRIAAVHHNPGPMASPAIEQWLAFLRAPENAAGVPPDLVERIASDFVGFEGRDALKGLASDAYVSLVFHGHHHASTSDQAFPWRGRDAGGPGDTRILSAGSWGLSPESGKLPRDQPVVMQLVRLDPAAAQLHPVLLTWDPNARLAGSVHAGRFLLDGQSRAERPIGLSLPPALRGRFRAEAERDPDMDGPTERDSDTDGPTKPRPRPPAPELAAVVERYRKRKSGSFERWDLRAAGPAPTAGNRPAEITLDEMYIPLRFAPELAPIRKLDLGVPISAEDLLESREPKVVIGGAGSGKTTWMRWTFRRLIRSSSAIPFFLELRAIAAAWTPQDTARSIESYLADALSECGASDPNAIVQALLADTSGPRPVILIDGWDEIGAQGQRLRERLVELCHAFPHVVVVVSSRPYGETRPAGAEAFRTLHIQPLSSDQILLLASRFHHHVHGHDRAAGTRATYEFMEALAAAPGAQSLAGTVLLLTMMLLLSREGPLPDRRHKLYTACLRNMLLHRVTQREREGVAVELDQQWRPDDSEERLRVVAELAYRMQTQGYEKLRRASLICSWNDAIDLLRADWTWSQRERFLRWLVASAGVLIDRTDGSIQFAHLSFQEHLAAYYLFITREGDERVAAVRSHMGDRDWWETLRLWAGLIGDQWPDKLGPVLDVLRAGPDTYWLAGKMLADGTGRPSDFAAWVAELPTRLSEPGGMEGGCASAWGACKQEDRRASIAATLASVREHLHWLEGTWHAWWCNVARLEIDPAPALLALEAPFDSAAAAARSRVLHGAAASWPDGGKLAMLRLWPSARAAIGVRLQTAISLGVRRPELGALFSAFWGRVRRPWTAEDRAHAEAWSRDFARYFARISGRDFGKYFTRDLGREVTRCFGHDFAGRFADHWGRYFARDFGRFFSGDFARYFAGDLTRNLVRDLGRDIVEDFVRYFVSTSPRDFNSALVDDSSREFIASFARSFGRDLGLPEPVLGAPWLPLFAMLEVSSLAGRASSRAALAHAPFPARRPLLALFHAACRASFAPGDASLGTAVAHACDAFDGDPLWPALARHVARISTSHDRAHVAPAAFARADADVARISTSDDRALLENLARHPEKREPPLSWGLQHYVRGDLVLDDDSVVTLDELCAQAGLAPLPLLEDMPDELDIPLDDAPA